MTFEQLTDEEVIEIQSLYDSGKKQEEIVQLTGRSAGAVSKYVKATRLRPKIPTIPQQEFQQPQQTVPVQHATPVQQATHVAGQPQKVYLSPAVPPYPDLVEPEEWLHAFLKQYRFGEPFIQAQCSRVRMRKELPHPTDLMADMKEMQSGIKNLRLIAYIADDYSFQVRQYKKDYDADRNYMPHTRQGIPIGKSNYTYDRREGMHDYSRPSRDYRDPYFDDGRDQRYVAPMPSYGGQDRLARIEDDLRRRDEAERRRLEQEILDIKGQIAHGGQQNPEMARLEHKIEQMEEDRRRKQDEEFIALKAQVAQAGGMNQADVQRMIEAERAKLTNADVINIIRQEFANRQGLSEMDVKSEEIKSKHDIEIKKLEESGETRTVIANAVQTGISQFGQAIARTLHEVGSEEERPVAGMTDGENMWQAECPYCSSMITAPLSANVVQCPNCNRQLEVTGGRKPLDSVPERTTTAPPIVKQPDEIVGTGGASFTVEQPTPLAERVATCPSCGTALSIPANAEQIECPSCNKRFAVGEQPPIIPKKQVEQPVAPPREVQQEQQPQYDFQQGINEELRRKEEPEQEKIPQTWTAAPPEEVRPAIPVDREPPLETSDSEIPDELLEENETPTEPIETTKDIPPEATKETNEPELPVEQPKPSEPEQTVKPVEGEHVHIDKEIPPMGAPLSEPVKTTDDKEFVCDFEGCGKSFETENQLRGHRIHHIKKRGKSKIKSKRKK